MKELPLLLTALIVGAFLFSLFECVRLTVENHHLRRREAELRLRLEFWECSVRATNELGKPTPVETE